MTQLTARELLIRHASSGYIDPLNLITLLLNRIDSYDLEGIVKNNYPMLASDMRLASLDEDW